jgi:hypothetical protein
VVKIAKSGQGRSFLTFLFALLSFSYVAYTGWRYFNPSLQTQTAYIRSVTEKYAVRGIAVRRETPLAAGNTRAVLSYVIKDADVVKKDGIVAEIYVNDDTLRLKAQIEQIDNKIEMLTTAQNVGKDTAYAESLNAQINESIGRIIRAVSQNRLEDVERERDRAQLLLGRKKISAGRSENFSENVKVLQQAKQKLTGELTPPIGFVKSPATGYFCSITDGYEHILSPEILDELSANEIRDLIAKDAPAHGFDSPGRVQTSHKWLICADIPAEETDGILENGSVNLDFGLPGTENVPVKLKSLRKDDGGALAVFECTLVNDQLIGLRQCGFEIIKKSYTGLLIPSEALRFENSVEGVYVLEGRSVRFKPVSVLYMDGHNMICDAKTAGGPRLYDEIIVKAKDLYHGKLVG